MARTLVRAHTWTGSFDPSVPVGMNPDLAYLHVEKVNEDLKCALESHRLGVDVGGMVAMHPELAFMYMHALAAAMAHQSIGSVAELDADQAAEQARCPVTDDDFDYLASSCTLEEISSAVQADDDSSTEEASAPTVSRDELALDYIAVAVAAVIHRDIGSIPVSKLIELRRRHLDEFIAFQGEVSEVAATICERYGNNPADDFRKMVIDDTFERRLGRQRADLVASLKSSGIDTVTGAMALKVAPPELLTSGAAALGATMPTNPVAGAVAIAACAIPFVASRRRTGAALRSESPAASYLLRIDDMQPTGLAERLAAGWRRLMAP